MEQDLVVVFEETVHLCIEITFVWCVKIANKKIFYRVSKIKSGFNEKYELFIFLAACIYYKLLQLF